ncbi:hypothetical protein M409DRAFT_20650 [Zasmidium cellare ATCC 36951]|uniref:Lytic polysaccharide monooxygenase n=1 Tax=Zasmidium cellare ATCC 36951 TaxID=1080233 RepID=A0A6A6CQT1_ZASCE|nr:uncharacterized protein M409DRAFT_20650 [Zasmidium cellare ATCC 36951]KAF2169431.1 hypothetical protein M409DRAFT_20650 [Zasmidium cellare ATCC 36951]
MKTTQMSLACALAALAKTSLAQMANGLPMNAYNSKNCDNAVDHIVEGDIGNQYPDCGTIYSSGIGDPYFETDPAKAGNFLAWFDIPQEISTDPHSCNIILASRDTSGGSLVCGAPLHIFTQPGCIQASVPAEDFVVTWCCSTNCQGITSKKRSEQIEAPAGKVADVAEVKRSNPFAKRPCGVTWSGKGADVYPDANTPIQKVTPTLSCNSEAGCTYSQATAVEESTTNTFMVSSSTEAGLFDIMSETLTLGYTFSSEQSHTVTKTLTFDYSQGQSGYGQWIPNMMCSDGEFGGSTDGCDGIESIPSGQQTACWPIKLADGSPDGTITFLPIN